MCWLLNQVLRAQGDGLGHSTGRKRVETRRKRIRFTDPEMAVCQPRVSPGEPCWAALLDAQGQAGPRGTICMTKGVVVWP